MNAPVPRLAQLGDIPTPIHIPIKLPPERSLALPKVSFVIPTLNEAKNLLSKLFGIVDRFDRSNDYERKQTDFQTESDIVSWIRSDAMPAFRKIDEAFRRAPSGQAEWIGTL